MILVTLQHPSPYYDDSYGVNSANNGPYGDAITKELIPAIETKFRALGEPWARLLTGGSTGGWISLAHQVLYRFLRWYPVALSGRRGFSLLPNCKHLQRHERLLARSWLDARRAAESAPSRRQHRGDDEGRELVELVQGDHCAPAGKVGHLGGDVRSGGRDGYRAHLGQRTGVIDKSVAAYWREHYDLRDILERDWATLGPKLSTRSTSTSVTPIHIF